MNPNGNTKVTSTKTIDNKKQTTTVTSKRAATAAATAAAPVRRSDVVDSRAVVIQCELVANLLGHDGRWFATFRLSFSDQEIAMLIPFLADTEVEAVAGALRACADYIALRSKPVE